VSQFRQRATPARSVEITSTLASFTTACP
jgi:hypothetical protein